MVNRDEHRARKAALALAAVALVLTPAIGVSAAERNRSPAISLSFDKISNFTPASADPRLAAMFGNRPLNDFKFTPAAAKDRPSQVRVALRASGAPLPTRPVEVAAAVPATAVAPTNYDLGVSVGWKRLAVSGDVSKVAPRAPIAASR